MWRILDNNTTASNSYYDTVNSTTYYPMQQQNGGTALQADTVRGVKASPPQKTITGATNINGSDIRITTSTPHGFVTGDKVFISDVLGQTRANGGWTITWVSATQFTLNGRTGTSSGSFNYTSGGTVYSFTAIPKSANGAAISPGAGLTGHILIQIVDQNGVWRDVTREILSMGMTVGEPNAIVQLQRPLWAAFTQGSRDGSTTSLVPNPHS